MWFVLTLQANLLHHTRNPGLRMSLRSILTLGWDRYALPGLGMQCDEWLAIAQFVEIHEIRG